MVPLDGYVLPDDTSLLGTGRGELPHLMYLLTLYPVLALFCNALFFLYAPFAVLHFATSGWRKLYKV